MGFLIGKRSQVKKGNELPVRAAGQAPLAEICRTKMLTKLTWLWICAWLAATQGVVTGGAGPC